MRKHRPSACKHLPNRPRWWGPHARGLLDLKVTEADVSDLRPPVLFFNGTESAAFEGIIAKRFRALRPDMGAITIEGAGHNVHRDRPSIVNPATLPLLALASDRNSW